MTVEEGTIQVNIRLYQYQLDQLDLQVKDSKFKNRSEYLRDLIEANFKKVESLKETEENLKESERILAGLNRISSSLGELFDESGMAPEKKREVLEVLSKFG